MCLLPAQLQSRLGLRCPLLTPVNRLPQWPPLVRTLWRLRLLCCPCLLPQLLSFRLLWMRHPQPRLMSSVVLRLRLLLLRGPQLLFKLYLKLSPP